MLIKIRSLYKLKNDKKGIKKLKIVIISDCKTNTMASQLIVFVLFSLT